MTLARRPKILLARLVRGAGLSPLFSRWLPLLVLAASLATTWHLWKNAQIQAERELRAEFKFSVQEAVREIESQMETYKLLLRGLQGLFASSGNVTRDEFRSYVSTLDLKTRYPGIQGLGYSLIVSPAHKAAHVAAVRAQGFPEYRIQPDSNGRLITSLVYVEPFAGHNLHAFGYDMYTDHVRRTAMERARDLNQAALSGKVALQQETGDDDQSGFVMYLPIYKNQAPLKSLADRQANIVGWVHAQFRAGELTTVLSTAHQSRIGLTIYDGKEATNEARLSGSRDPSQMPPQRAQHHIQIKAIKPLTIAGRPWTLEVHSLPAMESRFDRDKPRFVAITGIGASLLLALLVQILVHGRKHALRMAKNMNHELIKSEYRWKFALEGAGEGVWDWNIRSGNLFLSRRWKEILGYAENELESRYESWERHLHPEDRQAVLDALDDYLEGKIPEYSVEARILCKDGGWKWVLMRGMVVSRDYQGKPLRMIGTQSDISERHAKDESLRLASTVFTTANEAMMVTDSNGRVVAVNPAFTRITGYTAEEIIGQSPDMLTGGATAPEVLAVMQHALQESGSWQGELVNRKKSGELYVAWVSMGSVQDVKGRTTNQVTMFDDISERKAIEDRMHYLAHYDHLTGLPNRALFSDRLRQSLTAARRNGGHTALMFVDLDKFKPVNDQLGHNIGDLLLQEVAHRLEDCIRESDTAARIGGDEFVVLLPTIEAEPDATVVAAKILQSIQQPFELAGHEIHISASIGIAIYPEHGKTDEAILTNADNAMYHAKNGGGNAIASFGEIGMSAG